MIQRLRASWRQGKVKTACLVFLAAFFAVAYLALPLFSAERAVSTSSAAAVSPGLEHTFEWFSPFKSDQYNTTERVPCWWCWGLPSRDCCTR